MSAIHVIRDPNIEIPKVYALLTEPAPEDGASEVSENPQTHVAGILAPLIRFGNVTIFSEDVVSFTLQSQSFIPECQFTFRDNFDFIRTMDKFDKNTDIQVQIIPPADEMARKINLVFLLNDISVSGEYVSCSCVYKCSGLYDTRFESYGQTTTFDLFDKLSASIGLGFASNVKGVEDKRWIYSTGLSLEELLQRETIYGGEQTLILDSWIDFHNNLILEDIYTRFKDYDSDLKIKGIPSVLQNTKDIPQVIELPGLTNSQAYHNCSLYIKNMRLIGENGDIVLRGDNRLIDTYDYENRKIEQLQLVDSDFEQTTAYKYLYCGERFETYNHFFQAQCNALFKKKILTNMIEIELGMPVLDIERGDRVNISWYDYNSLAKGANKEQDDDTPKDENTEMLNKQYSGQYLVTGVTINFENSNRQFKWSYLLKLTKPDS